MLEKIKGKIQERALEWLIAILISLLGAILAGIPSEVRERIIDTPSKRVLWAVVGLLGILGLWSLAYIHSIRKQLKSTMSRAGIPNQTLAVLPRHEAIKYYWSATTRNNRPAMALSAEFIITNLTNMDIRPSGAR